MKREEEGEGCVMKGGAEEGKKEREDGVTEGREEAGEDKRMVNDRTRRWRRGERQREGECDRSLLPSFCVEA